MKCPLTQGYIRISADEESYAVRDCLKEECAWWYKENDACSILTLAQGSTYIHRVLLSIEYKMPHEMQFRK